jgi:hypothetical protein
MCMSRLAAGAAADEVRGSSSSGHGQAEMMHCCRSLCLCFTGFRKVHCSCHIVQAKHHWAHLLLSAAAAALTSNLGLDL